MFSVRTIVFNNFTVHNENPDKLNTVSVLHDVSIFEKLCFQPSTLHHLACIFKCLNSRNSVGGGPHRRKRCIFIFIWFSAYGALVLRRKICLLILLLLFLYLHSFICWMWPCRKWSEHVCSLILLMLSLYSHSFICWMWPCRKWSEHVDWLLNTEGNTERISL